MDRFAAARLKIERANKHIADFESIINGLKDAHTSSLERYEAIGCQVISYAPPDIPQIGVTMALVIGDAIHNLRIAIEYAYLGAVERHARSQFDSHTKFPTGQTRKNVEDALKNRKIDVIAPKLFERIVTEIKPYTVGGNELVKMLHDLDISDKHWLLIPVARAGHVSNIVVEDEKGTVQTISTHPVTGDGPYTITFPLKYKIKDHGKLTVDIVFGESNIGTLQGMPILDDLKTFSKLAFNIIERLRSI